MFAQQAFQVRLVTLQVAERRAVLKRERQWFESVVEAQQVDRAGNVAGGPKSGKRVGRRSEADIPEDKFAYVAPEPLDQAQLPDIQRLGLGHRADHRMEGLVMGHGMDAVGAIGEFD
jgi:hypothetical protein